MTPPSRSEPSPAGREQVSSMSGDQRRDASGVRVPAPSGAAAVEAPAAASRDTGAAAAATSSPESAVHAKHINASTWVDGVARLALRGPVRELAGHASFIAWSDGVLRLSLPASDEHMKTPFLVAQLADALAPLLGATPRIQFESSAAVAGETLHGRTARERDARQAAAEETFLADPNVQRLMQQRGAKLVPDSIRPHDEG